MNFFSVASMLKGVKVEGEIPDTKQAYNEVLALAIPSVLEMALMSLIGSLDTMMVGKVLDANALAAVAICGQPRMLLLALFFALNVGVTAIVARRKGEGLPEDANKTLRNALIIILGISIVMMVVALLTAKPLLTFAGAGSDIIDDALSYYNILAWFLPINALTICICAAQRGVGNTRVTLYVNTVSNLVNVVFNYLLIGGEFGFPRMEVSGAALATGIGFAVGFIMCIVTITGRRSENSFLSISAHDDWKPHKPTIKSIINIGQSAAVEQLFLRVGFFTYAKIIAGLGTIALAAHSICMQFLSMSFSVGDGIGVAGTSLVGQMLGQKRPDKAVVYAKVSQRMALVAAFVLATLFVTFRYPLVGLFLNDTDQAALALAAQVMICVGLFQPFQTSSVVISGALRGAGDTKYVAIVMMICVSVIRPSLSILAIYLIRDVFGLPEWALLGCWSASIIDMTIRLTAVYKRFNSGKWHHIQV